MHRGSDFAMHANYHKSQIGYHQLHGHRHEECYKYGWRLGHWLREGELEDLQWFGSQHIILCIAIAIKATLLDTVLITALYT